MFIGIFWALSERETHPSEEKGICLEEKWLWEAMLYLMTLTNGKGSKQLCLWNVRNIMFVLRRYCLTYHDRCHLLMDTSFNQIGVYYCYFTDDKIKV